MQRTHAFCTKKGHKYKYVNFEPRKTDVCSYKNPKFCQALTRIGDSKEITPLRQRRITQTKMVKETSQRLPSKANQYTISQSKNPRTRNAQCRITHTHLSLQEPQAKSKPSSSPRIPKPAGRKPPLTNRQRQSLPARKTSSASRRRGAAPRIRQGVGGGRVTHGHWGWVESLSRGRGQLSHEGE